MAVLTAERVERPPWLFGQESARPRTAADRAGGLGGGLTLDEAIVGVWEGLAAQVVVACPVCHGLLRPHGAPDVVGGRCDDCGTSLS